MTSDDKDTFLMDLNHGMWMYHRMNVGLPGVDIPYVINVRGKPKYTNLFSHETQCILRAWSRINTNYMYNRPKHQSVLVPRPKKPGDPNINQQLVYRYAAATNNTHARENNTEEIYTPCGSGSGVFN